MALRPPRIDFLLPHATWDHPPARRPGAEHEYADWLTAIYDRWIADGRPAEIRTFDSIISTLRGGDSLTEALGLGPTGLVVIETDGSYEQVDSLKVAYEGAPETGLNVFSHSLDMVARHPGIAAREQGIAGLCQTCRECPVVSSCGGGLYTHRYRDGSGFDNPSVYCAGPACADLARRSTHHAQQSDAHDQCRRLRVRWLRAWVRRLRSTRSSRRSAAWCGPCWLRCTRKPQLGGCAGTGPGPAAGGLVGTGRGGAGPAGGTGRAAGPSVPAGLGGALAGTRCGVRDAARCRRPGGRHGGWPPISVTWARSLLPPPSVAGWAAPSRCPSSAPPSACRRWADWCSDRSQARRTLTTRPRPQPSASSAMRSSFRSAIRAGRSAWLGCWPAQADAVPAPGGTRHADWQPVRTLRAPGWCLALDDTDPYRDCQPWPAAPRLTEAEVSSWRHDFRLAWQRIEAEYAAYAPGLAAGLTTLTPLTASPDGAAVSAAARQAFGAVAASAPGGSGCPGRATHRTNSSGPNSVRFLTSSTYTTGPTTGCSRRPGARRRSISTGCCRVLTRAWRSAEGRRSAEWRMQTREAIDLLLGSGALTPLGERFVRQMRRSAARWPADTTSADARARPRLSQDSCALSRR